jgi:glycosyltransferase involved in cell wall biosynthesis
MKIVYHHRTRATDAQGIHIFEIVNALRAQGHEVDIAALVKTTAPRTLSGAAQRTAGRPSIWSEVVQMGYNFAGLPMLLWKLRDGSTGFIYERHSLFNVSGVLAARITGCPIAVEVNSPLALESARDGAHFTRFSEWVERTVLNMATKVFVVSTPLARILTEMGVDASKIEIMPNGVNLDRFGTEGEEAGLRHSLGLNGFTVVGFSGWFKPWHGIELMLSAFRERKLDLLGARVLLVGDGPSMPSLRAYVDEHGLGDSVVFTGGIPHDLLPQYVSLFDIAVQPTANEYCCPMKILEYMAMGKPILAPRQENILDILRDSEAYLFEPGSTAALASGLERLVRDRELRAETGARAREGITKRQRLWSANAALVVQRMAPSISRLHNGARLEHN